MADFVPTIDFFQNTVLVSGIIQRAYRMARALKNPGQGVSNSESLEGLSVLNSMIDGWKIENLLIIYTRRSLQNMVAGQKTYGVGPAQDFDIERPEKIHRAGFIVTGNPTSSEIPMEIILTFEEWAQFVVKDVGSTIPLALYYQASVPYGNAQVWPVPTIDSQIVIYTPETLNEFRTVDDAVIVPKGYREMLAYNLAVAIHELYPEKGMEPSVSRKAEWYKSRVKANQLTPIFIGSDPAVMQEQRKSGTRWGGNPKAWTPYY